MFDKILKTNIIVNSSLENVGNGAYVINSAPKLQSSSAKTFRLDMAKRNDLLVAALRVLMLVVAAAWVSLWLLKPTQLWTKTWKGAEAWAKATIFGYYGLDFAVYTFPVIAMAIIGCLYLNLLPREPRPRQARSSISSFSDPLVVNTLLGVISTAEIISASLFLLFLAWTFYARISNDFKKLTPDKSLKLNLWQLKYLRVATRFGLLAEACLALMLLPILRGLSLFRVLGIQFEASVRYHIWLSTAMIFSATLHGASTLFVWGTSHYIDDEVWKWQGTGRIYLAGEIALATCLVLWLTSLSWIRRRWFEIFYYTHHLYILFFIFVFLHVGDRHFYSVFSGIFLFALDKVLRIIQSRPETRILSAKVFPCKAVELVLPKETGLKYTPTSVIFMKVPRISATQWHSFSVCSSSSVDDHTMSVIVKCEGSWTDSLYQIITSDSDFVSVGIEGPYGPATLDFLRFDSLLLIAGGIGITPFLSILQELDSVQCRSPTQVQLVYVVKKSEYISLLSSILTMLLNRSEENLHLKVKVFVTQEEKPSLTVKEVLMKELGRSRTVEFRPRCSSCYAIRGPESSVLMAGFVGFSSILFLVSLICLNRVFSKQKGPSWVVDLLVIASFSISMLCTALLGVVLRRRKEDPQVSQYQAKGAEAGLVQESGVLEEHEVHFGARPDFRDVFEEFGDQRRGSDVGVLVCGPETMKDEVAKTWQQQLQDVGKDGKRTRPRFSFHSLNFSL